MAIAEASIPTLETDRLILRAFREEDLDAYAGICADPEVMRFLGGQTWSREEAWRHLAWMLGHWQLRGYGMWAVEERESGAMVGRIGFLNPVGHPGFEIAWTLGRPSWGKGFATEGGRLALAYAFSELGREQVISLIQPANERSIRVAERLGERFERSIEFHGLTHSVYGIHRDMWRSAG